MFKVLTSAFESLNRSKTHYEIELHFCEQFEAGHVLLYLLHQV